MVPIDEQYIYRSKYYFSDELSDNDVPVRVLRVKS